jgi:ankyrin repeat protein
MKLKPSLLILLICITALVYGCGSSPESARKELVKLGKEFNEDSFIECVGDNDKQAVKLFIEAGFDVNTPADTGITALHIAAMKGNTDIVKTLLEHGANPNAVVASGSEKSSTPLMAAAMCGDVEALKLLLDKGAEVNAKDGNGWVALDFAAEQTNLEVLKILWQHGAPTITDVMVARALSDFQLSLRKQVVKSLDAGDSANGCRKFIAEQLANFKQEQGFNADQLLQAKICAFGVVWDVIDRFAMTQTEPVVTDAARQAVKQFVEFRKELQAEPDVQRDLLLMAAGKGDAGKVKWLLENGADVNVKDESGFTPLTLAISSDGGKNGVLRTVAILLDAGADYDSKQGPYGMTPTMVAAGLRSADILKQILAKKPNVNTVGGKGQTALKLAEAADSIEAVTLLKDAGAKD